MSSSSVFWGYQCQSSCLITAAAAFIRPPAGAQKWRSSDFGPAAFCTVCSRTDSSSSRGGLRSIQLLVCLSDIMICFFFLFLPSAQEQNEPAGIAAWMLLVAVCMKPAARGCESRSASCFNSFHPLKQRTRPCVRRQKWEGLTLVFEQSSPTSWEVKWVQWCVQTPQTSF